VSVFYSLALKYTDKSSMVSGLNGVGMIGMVVFAWLVLKERIGRQELVGAALVLVGTTVMGYFEAEPQTQQYALARAVVSASLLVAIFAPAALVSWRIRRFHGFTFGALAGVLIGISVILGDIALLRAGNSFFGQFAYPFPYIALGIGLIAVITTQLAFWRARAMVVIPTINSFMILVPVVLEYFVFATVLKPASYVGIATIVVGVVLLTATETQNHIGDEASELSGRHRA
jgi:drug/metabolite transporter (DMT)-like permease